MKDPQELLAEIKTLENKCFALVAESRQCERLAASKKRAWKLLFGESLKFGRQIKSPPVSEDAGGFSREASSP